MKTGVVRAVTIPVAAPVDLSWAELDALLVPTFRLATDLANWCVRRLFVLDDATTAKAPKYITEYSGYDDAMTCTRCALPWKDSPLAPRRRRARLGCEKCITDWRCGDPSPCVCAKPAVVVRKEEIDKPPREQCQCSGEPTVRLPQRAAWVGAMQSLGLVVDAAKRKYIQQRFDVIVRHQSNLLTYRFPQPFPIHNASWHLTVNELQQPVLSLALPGAGRIAVRLRQGREFGRQLAMLRQVLDGTAKRGEAALYRDRKGKLLAKIVGTFPIRGSQIAPIHACFLHTDSAALLVAEVDGRATSITNGDHIRREVAKHKTFLQRASEDKKREVRMDRQQRSNFDKAIEERCGKQNDRVKTAVHQLAAQVVRFCQRQRVGIVIYDDADREFIPEGFAWHAVGERLADKLRGVGITLLARTDLPQEEFDEWLANPNLVRATALAGQRLIASTKRKGPHPSICPRTKKSPKSAG